MFIALFSSGLNFFLAMFKLLEYCSPITTPHGGDGSETMWENVITATWEQDGFRAKVRATYKGTAEGDWLCELVTPSGAEDDRWTVEPFAEIEDMLGVGIEYLRQEHAFNAGPYSNARCGG